MNDKNVSASNMNGAQQCQYDIIEVFRNCTSTSVTTSAVYAAHFLSIAAGYNYPFGVSIDMILEESSRMGIRIDDSAIINELSHHWEDLKTLCNRYAVEDFKNAAYFQMPVIDKREDFETPACLTKLGIKLLNVQEGESVVDLCCGTGNVAMEMHNACPGAQISGFEVNPMIANVAKIRAQAGDAEISVSNCDVFEVPQKNVRFNKVFSNYPFGMNLRQLGSGQQYLQQIESKVPTIRKATSSDWVFNCLMMDLLEDGGKAVAIMTNGSTWNSIDAETRRYFVEQGFVECVIALPAKLFSFTNIPTTMIVLSHGNNGVQMVDASDLCVKGRRQNTITDDIVSEICNLCHAESNISRNVSIREIEENEYLLNPSRYFVEEDAIINGVPFERVIKSISRGAHCSAEQLDAMDSKEPTNMQFLKTADIQDGLIIGPLQYLSYIEGNFEKYCINDRNLIISKIGAPNYKIAVATVAEGHKLLANANLYVIELDESKVDPYYLKAYLESAEGQVRFKNIAAGTTVLSIGVKDLKAMIIPLPSMEEQQRIAARYKAAMEDVLRLRNELQEATERMKRVFEEG